MNDAFAQDLQDTTSHARFVRVTPRRVFASLAGTPSHDRLVARNHDANPAALAS